MKALLLLPFLLLAQINTGHYRKAGSSLIISTVFNEGTAGANIVGTKPALDKPNSTWSAFVDSSAAVFKSGGGATFGPATAGSAYVGLDVGTPNSTITWTGIVFANGTDFGLAVRGNNPVTQGLFLDWNNGALTLTDVGNVNTTIATGTTGSTSGTITWTLNGQSVSVNVFGTVLSGTIPSGSPTLSLTNILVSPSSAGGTGNTTTMTAAGLTVH